MGRAKLKMEMIPSEKSRILTLKKRKEGLIKKMHELTTLCDVSACMIIHDPAKGASSVWPENSDDHVRRLIDGYRAKNNVAGGVKSYGLEDFFSDRQKEIEAELSKLRKKNSEAKYPTWGECFSAMNEFQLKNLGAELRAKAQNVRARIQLLREKSEVAANNLLVYKYPQFYGLGGHEFKPTEMMPPQQNNFFGAGQIPVDVQSYYDRPPQYYQPLGGNYVNYPTMDQNLGYWFEESEREKSEVAANNLLVYNPQFYDLGGHEFKPIEMMPPQQHNNFFASDQIPMDVQSYYDRPPQYYQALGGNYVNYPIDHGSESGLLG